MTRLIEFLIALALVLALFLVIGLILPSKRHLEESVETNRRMTIVFDTLNSVRRMKDWNQLIPNKATWNRSPAGANHSIRSMHWPARSCTSSSAARRRPR